MPIAEPVETIDRSLAFDPRDPAFLENPYPVYARLRAEEPIHRAATGDLWLTRHTDVETALTDRRLGRSSPPYAARPKALAGEPVPPSMLFQNPPDHTRLRALVMRAFTPRMIERLRPRVAAIAAELLDRVASQHEFDLVDDFAFPLPAIVIAEMLGVPAADRDRFHTWTSAVAAAIDTTSTPEARARGALAREQMADYFAELVTIRRDEPRDDLISGLVAVQQADDRLCFGELLSMCALLLAAGHETTVNLIANGVVTLLRHPAQLALLSARPDLLPRAVEELLRYEPPVQVTDRVALEDLDVSGTLVRQGERVIVSMAAANHDPAVFRQPDTLDITRITNPHLAFGHGIHFCLGASLARSEGQLAVLAGLSADAIAGLERGRRSAPHADTLRRLMHALELSADERNLFVRAAEPASRASRAPAAASPTPRNLPVSLSSFIGRTEALVALRRLLTTSSPRTRLLTLVGPGGIGKTRLALEIARSLLDTTAAFADGAWLTDLAPLDDPAAVPGAVAASLEVGGVPSSTTASLVRTVGDRRLLLVLDNCEHLIDACVRLADALLRACPNMAILATSREALAIPGEVLWPVSALSLAEGRLAPSPDDVWRSEAGRLFVQRASAVRPDFSLTDDNASTVAELCQQLDGIPLAIELAAARVNAFDVHTIVTRLADRLLVLRSGDRLAPPRHQTLQALVQWSYDLLAPEEQRLFARLAVFAGGWDIDAVEAVAADDKASAAETLDLLGRLVDKSLVVRVADRAGVGRTRYGLLETLRQFAALPLAASGELPRLRERHASYYLAVLEESEPDIEGPRQAEELRRLEQDIDNLRAALDWCVAADRAEPALRGSWSLAVLAWLRGYLEEVDGRLTALLDLPSALAAPADARAKALVAAGYVAFYRGQLGRAHRLVEDGLQVFRGLDRARETGQALVWFGLVVDAEGDHERSRRYFVEALQIFRENGDVFWTARAATNLGRCLAQLGDVTNAIPLLQEALALRRQLGDRRGVANTLHHLADALEGSGDLREAHDLAAEALSIAQAVGDRFVTVRALIGLGRVAYALDDLSLATTHLEQAMAIARGDAFGHEVAEVAVLLAFVALERGDPVLAREFADDGLRNAQRHNRRVEAARALFLLGAIARCEAQQTEARARFRASAVVYQQVADPNGVALAIAGLATVLDAGDHASHLAGAAEAVLQNGGTHTWTIERHALQHALAELRKHQSHAGAWANGRTASLDEIVADAMSG